MQMLNTILNKVMGWMDTLFSNSGLILMLVGLMLLSKMFQIRVKK